MAVRGKLHAVGEARSKVKHEGLAAFASRLLTANKGTRLRSGPHVAVALDRKGRLKGGKARADKLTPSGARRSRKAAAARWGEREAHRR